jgi:hypothetical protein
VNVEGKIKIEKIEKIKKLEKRRRGENDTVRRRSIMNQDIIFWYKCLT